jgi:hypothetical protein
MIYSSGHMAGKRGVARGVRGQDAIGWFQGNAEKWERLEAVRLTGASFSTFRALILQSRSSTSEENILS